MVWEKLGVLTIVGLGMPSGVYMLNECLSWKFKSLSTRKLCEDHTITRVTGTTFDGGNKATVVCKHNTYWTTPASNKILLHRMAFNIRHTWVGPAICKLKGMPPTTFTDDHL